MQRVSEKQVYTPYFFFNDTATTKIYTLSLHNALPISVAPRRHSTRGGAPRPATVAAPAGAGSCPRPAARRNTRSEEHTSELQSLTNLVCRLLLEKKKKPRRGRSPIQEPTCLTSELLIP